MESRANQRPASKHLGALVLVGLTPAGLLYAMTKVLRGGLDGGRAEAVVLATVCGVVAALAMLFELRDRWLHGGSLVSAQVTLLRVVAVVAFLIAMATSFLTSYIAPALILLPSGLVYVSVVMPPKKPGQRSREAQAARRAEQSRQRRGGRRRR